MQVPVPPVGIPANPAIRQVMGEMVETVYAHSTIHIQLSALLLQQEMVAMAAVPVLVEYSAKQEMAETQDWYSNWYRRLTCTTCDINYISDSIICTGNGGNGGYSCCNNAGNGGNSGDGIINGCINTEIKDSTIRTGNGGMGGVSDTDTSGNGGNSGNAITTQGTQIINVILSTGNAGNGAPGAHGGNGGNAGYGVFVNGACECQIRGIVVESTGNGGQGGNSTQTLMPGNGGNGGNGGDAMHITQNSSTPKYAHHISAEQAMVALVVLALVQAPRAYMELLVVL